MERYEIEAFLALAEELHFARTAERLHVSPGRVSQTIKALERRVGGALFERSSRRVVLTPVGQQLRDDLLPAYQQIQRAIAHATAAYQDIRGVLRFGFTASWSGELALRAADAFSSRHSRCVVELQEVTYNAAIVALREKVVDLLVAELPVEEPGISVGPVLFREGRALVVPAVHPLAVQETVSLEDLALLPLVMGVGVSPTWRDEHFPRRTPAGRHIEHGPAGAGWQELLSLVGAGKGATVATNRAGHYYARPDIAYVPFDDAPPVEYALMWRDSDQTVGLKALVQTVLEFAARSADRPLPR
ncbi:LysR family transcriptional regulator [Streptomyces sp. NBC_00006]|uniref:LysR family transcriptional regulator n=1 Tax=Streptomyces sp. NBC_00006 TaxID=2975619 RepID=UPI00224D7039|nr:LysR family transcriptional regulator [Streptomyces sp. NBC_00006]MCX5535644.1 LysR family transcriptional regulator [Streptomyces sp. NBC_00006]